METPLCCIKNNTNITDEFPYWWSQWKFPYFSRFFRKWPPCTIISNLLTIRKYYSDNLPSESTPNSIFMSTRAQLLEAHARSNTSKTVIAVLLISSTSCRVIKTLFGLNFADMICSSDHCGSWLASS